MKDPDAEIVDWLRRLPDDARERLFARGIVRQPKRPGRKRQPSINWRLLAYRFQQHKRRGRDEAARLGLPVPSHQILAKQFLAEQKPWLDRHRFGIGKKLNSTGAESLRKAVEIGRQERAAVLATRAARWQIIRTTFGGGRLVADPARARLLRNARKLGLGG